MSLGTAWHPGRAGIAPGTRPRLLPDRRRAFRSRWRACPLGGLAFRLAWAGRSQASATGPPPVSVMHEPAGSAIDHRHARRDDRWPRWSGCVRCTRPSPGCARLRAALRGHPGHRAAGRVPTRYWLTVPAVAARPDQARAGQPRRCAGTRRPRGSTGSSSAPLPYWFDAGGVHVAGPGPDSSRWLEPGHCGAAALESAARP